MINSDVRHACLLLTARIALMGIHTMRRNAPLARLKIAEFVRRGCAPSARKTTF